MEKEMGKNIGHEIPSIISITEPIFAMLDKYQEKKNHKKSSYFCALFHLFIFFHYLLSPDMV